MPFELAQQRRENMRVIDNEDGTRTAEISTGPVHYLDDSSNWQPIQLNFQQVSQTEWRSDRNAYIVRAYRDTGAGVNWVEITHRNSGKGVRWQVPLSASVGTNYVEFAGFGLTWRYYLTKGGLKLQSSPVATSLGVRTYSFTAQLVGGATLPQVMAHGGLESDAFLIPRAVAICADGIRRTAGVFSRVGNIVSFDLDDRGFPPQAYPYRIDPTTTFNVSASANDAQVLGSGSYPPAYASTDATDAALYCMRLESGGIFYVSNVLMRWDTSSLGASANVSGATLRVYFVREVDNDSRDVTFDWHSWTPTPGSSNYTATAQTNAHAGTDLTTLPVGADHDFVLTNAAANVNKTGFTGLRGHISGGQPTSGSQFNIASFDDTTNPEPRLLVTYTTGWTGRTAPDAIVSTHNLVGSLTDVDDDPDSPDANWLVVG